MSITFYCPECRIALEAEQEDLGQVVECGNCEKEIKVPQVDFNTGDMIGSYRILEIVGHGSMGIVYKAVEEGLGLHVALKVLHPHLVDDEEYVADFVKEAEVMGRINHPNIVRAINVGEDKGYRFLAMQLVEGDTALHRIKEQDLYSEEEALTVALKIAQALGEVWDKYQMLHRDIKPSNIMIDKNGQVMLMDLGISVLANEMEEGSDIVGTPFYMSPEQARGEAVDLRSDMFSLGSTLYHFLTGEEPFKGGDVFEIIHHVKHSKPNSVREKNIRIGQNCSNFIAKLMNKDMDKRFSSWEEVEKRAQAIIDAPYATEAELQGLAKKNRVSVSVSSESATTTNPNKKILVLGFAAILFVLTIGLAFIVGRKSADLAKDDFNQSPTVIEEPVASTGNSEVEEAIDQTDANDFVTEKIAEVDDFEEEDSVSEEFVDDFDEENTLEADSGEDLADEELVEAEPELTEEEINTQKFEEESSEFISHYMNSKLRKAKKVLVAIKENEDFKELLDYRLRILAFDDLLTCREEILRKLSKMKGAKLQVYFPDGDRYEDVYLHAASTASGIYVKFKVAGKPVFKKVPYYYLNTDFCQEVYDKKIDIDIVPVAMSYVYYRQGKMKEAKESLAQLEDSMMKTKALAVLSTDL